MSKYGERLARIIDIQAELDVRKKLYDEYDALVMELQQEGFLEEQVRGITLKLKDNFAEKNTAWRVAGVKHYEILPVKAKKEKKA